MKRLSCQLLGITAGVLAVIGNRPAPAAEPAAATPDFGSMSIEDLMKIPVTSFSKREEQLSQVSGALHVITQDDIRRSGAPNIAEALRMAPGLQVARVDSHTWAISARGFNDVFANKLLVLQDGRSIYTPLFSGVFWDVQDTMMEDIDRIEVIRGPGATLWGANAVNGVINIITKRARDTQGLLLSGGGGTEEIGFGGLRYGGQVSPDAHFRVYAKYFNRDASVLPDGQDADDRWHQGRGGFRFDWDASEQNLLTVQGDLYAGWNDQTFTRTAPTSATNDVADTYDVNGGNLLARWTHTISEESSWSVQAYYDRTYRDAVIFRETRDTADVDFQHRFPILSWNDLIWGLGYRWTQDQTRETDNFDVSMDPADRSTQLFSAFVQDEIAIIPDRLSLTVGSKFEHNDFTGFEFQPSGRITWTPHSRHTIWGAVSRAVRTPSRADHDVQLNQQNPMGGLLSIRGDDSFESEILIAYEAGYRVQLHKRASLDLAAFYNDYEEIRGLQFGGFEAPATAVMLLHNVLEGESYGGEIAANFQFSDWFRCRASYSYLDLQIHPKPGTAGDANSERNIEGSSPHHQFSIASGIELPAGFGIDWTVRYVDQLPAVAVESYVGLDVRLSWRPTPDLEVSVVGLNLLDNQHPEFQPTSIRTQRTEVERSVYGKITWRF